MCAGDQLWALSRGHHRGAPGRPRHYSQQRHRVVTHTDSTRVTPAPPRPGAVSRRASRLLSLQTPSESHFTFLSCPPSSLSQALSTRAKPQSLTATLQNHLFLSTLPTSCGTSRAGSGPVNNTNTVSALFMSNRDLIILKPQLLRTAFELPEHETENQMWPSLRPPQGQTDTWLFLSADSEGNESSPNPSLGQRTHE